MAGVDTAFEILSDPVRLPAYVPILRLDDSTAIDGELDPDAEIEDRDGARAAGYVADRKSRTITWGDAGGSYGGSIAISERTSGTSDVTVRLRTPDDADSTEVGRVFDEAVSNIRRLISSLR